MVNNKQHNNMFLNISIIAVNS